jgi:hypothetical protein
MTIDFPDKLIAYLSSREPASGSGTPAGEEWS